MKLCDFGFATALRGDGAAYTDYVSTRWYRSPELLVGDTAYGTPVDIWALGCLGAELATGLPLFPGESDLGTLAHVVTTIGNLPALQAGIFRQNPLFRDEAMPAAPHAAAASLAAKLPAADSQLVDLLNLCLICDPARRATTADLIAHPYFAEMRRGFGEALKQRVRLDRAEAAAAARQPITLTVAKAERSGRGAGGGGGAPEEAPEDTPADAAVAEEAEGGFVQAPIGQPRHPEGGQATPPPSGPAADGSSLPPLSPRGDASRASPLHGGQAAEAGTLQAPRVPSVQTAATAASADIQVGAEAATADRVSGQGRGWTSGAVWAVTTAEVSPMATTRSSAASSADATSAGPVSPAEKLPGLGVGPATGRRRRDRGRRSGRRSSSQHRDRGGRDRPKRAEPRSQSRPVRQSRQRGGRPGSPGGAAPGGIAGHDLTVASVASIRSNMSADSFASDEGLASILGTAHSAMGSLASVESAGRMLGLGDGRGKGGRSRSRARGWPHGSDAAPRKASGGDASGMGHDAEEDDVYEEEADAFLEEEEEDEEEEEEEQEEEEVRARQVADRRRGRHRPRAGTARNRNARYPGVAG